MIFCYFLSIITSGYIQGFAIIENITLENISVLYVEDDYIIRENTAQTLALFNINVICAENGLEGLEQFKNTTKKIDLILTDIKMPKLDGIGMIKEIRKIDKFIPIVITTAHQETSFLQTSIELGVSAYVLKPIDIYQLRDTLIKAIEPKILKEELLKKNEELLLEIKKNKEKHKLLISQSKFASMGEMINMIAHQWRQPLAAIGTATFNLKFKIQTNKFDLNTKEGQTQHRDFSINKLDEIENYVQNLTTTIDDFRNFYKTDKTLTKKNISEPIKSALKLIKSSFKTNNIQITENYNSSISVNIFENEIIHVILNILNNAQDNFLEKQKETMHITISSNDTKDGCKIDIYDNGGGIKEDIIDKIFEPYFSTKKEKNGTGIGLYMSKIIIEKHHQGKISVENKEEGACFSLIFPRHNKNI